MKSAKDMALLENCGQGEKNGKSPNDIKVGHPGELDLNPEAGKLAIKIEV